MAGELIEQIERGRSEVPGLDGDVGLFPPRSCWVSAEALMAHASDEASPAPVLASGPQTLAGDRWYPGCLCALSSNLSPPVQAVDVVGQAGKPKTITGFQTHTTPVLLAHGERAELATEEHLPVTPILEGFVILRKNPNYDV